MNQMQKLTPELYTMLFNHLAKIEDIGFQLETIAAMMEISYEYEDLARQYLDEVKENHIVAAYLESAHKRDLLDDETFGNLQAAASMLKKTTEDAYKVLFAIKPDNMEDRAG